MYYITYKQWTSHQMKVAHIEPQYKIFENEKEVICFLDRLDGESEIIQPEKFYYDIIQIIKGERLAVETVNTHKLVPHPFKGLTKSTKINSFMGA